MVQTATISMALSRTCQPAFHCFLFLVDSFLSVSVYVRSF